jgi:hypothetical protein
VGVAWRKNREYPTVGVQGPGPARTDGGRERAGPKSLLHAGGSTTEKPRETLEIVYHDPGPGYRGICAQWLQG